ncbi:MAG: hypothetical protein ABSC18_11310 [Verrucomicrobiota bacterium]|jgi:hypothetical protein
MKSLSPIIGLRATAWAAAAFLSLSLAVEARAQKGIPLAPAAPAQKQTIPNDGTEAGLLRQAYGLLSLADHDYQGHRARAMKQIEVAAQHLGITLRGDGKGHETQATSDAQLRNAQALLVQASGGLKPGQGLAHVKLAIAQLNVALAIR